mmetsp:Transcript_68000/g.181733  ORF Transcript_68000/g.181733 Transcript_68000/m.181733 type:complete len:203 (+) Transcript_68000:157-765(+)
MASSGSEHSFLRIPEVIDTLAKDEKILRWDSAHDWFEVMDGVLFEEKFNALRCIRGKRKEGTVDRPFARMHVHFVLARGDRWAGTGSAFRPKGHTSFKSMDPCWIHQSRDSNDSRTHHSSNSGRGSISHVESDDSQASKYDCQDSDNNSSRAADHEFIKRRKVQCQSEPADRDFEQDQVPIAALACAYAHINVYSLSDTGRS